MSAQAVEIREKQGTCKGEKLLPSAVKHRHQLLAVLVVVVQDPQLDNLGDKPVLASSKPWRRTSLLNSRICAQNKIPYRSTKTKSERITRSWLLGDPLGTCLKPCAVNPRNIPSPYLTTCTVQRGIFQKLLQQSRHGGNNQPFVSCSDLCFICGLRGKSFANLFPLRAC